MPYNPLQYQGQEPLVNPFDLFGSVVGGLSPVVAASNAPDSVKSGAAIICTGVNDQILINTLLAVSPAITLSLGDFYLSGPIIPPSGSQISGSGIGTFLHRNGTLVGSYASLFEVTGASVSSRVSGVVIRDLKGVGPSTFGAQIASNGVTVNFADDVLLQGLDLSGFGALGDDGTVATTGSTRVIIRGGSHHDSLNGPIFGKAGGVTPPSSTDCKVEFSTLYNNWADGTHGQNCDRIQWIGNISFNNGESGIDLLGCYSCVITGNSAFGNQHSGIEVGQTVSTGREDRYHSITGNVCTANNSAAFLGGGGIYLSGKTSYCTVSGNVCSLNVHNGIHAGNTSVSYLVEYNDINHNVCELNGQVGIHVSGNANNNSIESNTSRNNVSRGIDFTTSGVTPLGNKVRFNKLGGNTGGEIFRSGGLDATTIVFQNDGYLTESKGSGTILDTTSSLLVTHNLASTPTSIQVTPGGNEALWISARTSTTFTVSRTGTSGARTFDWNAQV